MEGINCSVHFLTLKQIGYEESNVAVTFYHDRTHFDPNQRNQYAEYAEEFSLQQGRQFILHNRLATLPNKVSKIKDQIREFDSLFQSNKDVKIESDLDTKRWSSSKNQIDFHSSFNSSLTKIIWFTANRVLLIMQDGVLVWLIIDTVSGDLIKILTDRTLTTQFGSSSSKLSGSSICDAALVIKPDTKNSTSLIFAYSDKSIIDIITLEKGFDDHMKSWKESEKLEKLSNFSPSLFSYEFSCPSVYLIEKRICMDMKINDNFFTIWWPNESQVTWQPSKNEKTDSQTFSLLERDDLRNNVLILNLNSSDKNLLEHVYKSDGLLLSCSYINKNSLLAVEQTETSTQKFSISIFRYDFPNELNDNEEELKRLVQAQKALKIKLISFSLNSKIVSIEQVKVAKKFALMLNQDQTLILYEIARNIVHKFKFNADSNASDTNFFSGIEWLIDDFLFAVHNVNGQVCVFDIAFNRIDLNYMTRYTQKFNSLSEYLNPNIFVPFNGSCSSVLTTSNRTSSNNRFVKLVSSRNIFTESLWSCFHFSNGPFGLFRISLPSNFNCIGLINHYIKSSHLYQRSDGNCKNSKNQQLINKSLSSAINLLNQLNWDEEANVCLASLFKILNFMLSGMVEFNLKTELLIEEALGSFYRPKRPLNEKTIYENKYQVSRYARKFFYQLLKNFSLNKAFLLAVDIGAKDLFNDLYYCSLDRNENQLAEVCRKKYHEIMLEEKQEKIRNELNRSVTTIDDNIMGLNDFDKYSVSSSENNSIESDNDSYCSLNEFDDLRSQIISTRLDEGEVNSLRNFKTYSEDEIQQYAKDIFNDNKFIHQLNFENLV